MFRFGILYYHHSSQMTSSMEGKEQEAASNRSNDRPGKARSQIAVSVFVIHLAWWPTNFGNFSKTPIALAFRYRSIFFAAVLKCYKYPKF